MNYETVGSRDRMINMNRLHHKMPNSYLVKLEELVSSIEEMNIFVP